MKKFTVKHSPFIHFLNSSQTIISACHTIAAAGMSVYLSAIKESIRLKLRMVNPYKINPKHTYFPHVPSVIAKLAEKQTMNRDTYALRFALPRDDKCLGLKIGSYVDLQLDGMSRSYMPLSRLDDLGYLDILVRDVFKVKSKESNSFSKKILEAPLGTEIAVIGPKTYFQYEGYGVFSELKEGKQQRQTFDHIGVIAHSTGITSSYLLYDYLSCTQDNKTGLSLLWLGDQPDDFIFQDELLTFAEMGKLNLNLMLTKPHSSWRGLCGQVTEQRIKDCFPPANWKKTVFILTGPDEYIKGWKDTLNSLGHHNIIN